ncbi:hypothetical protein F4777DRAFT_285703 [Nemania sp. FL0916]|nr:hypothetical protein F4777DRAFT_285703 [Nemania sp. FL0916]
MMTATTTPAKPFPPTCAECRRLDEDRGCVPPFDTADGETGWDSCFCEFPSPQLFINWATAVCHVACNQTGVNSIFASFKEFCSGSEHESTTLSTTIIPIAAPDGLNFPSSIFPTWATTKTATFVSSSTTTTLSTIQTFSSTRDQSPEITAQNTSSSRRLNIDSSGLIIGGSIGGFLLLVVACLLYVMYRKRGTQTHMSDSSGAKNVQEEYFGKAELEGSRPRKPIEKAELDASNIRSELEGTAVEDGDVGIYIRKPELEGTPGEKGKRSVCFKKYELEGNSKLEPVIEG